MSKRITDKELLFAQFMAETHNAAMLAGGKAYHREVRIRLGDEDYATVTQCAKHMGLDLSVYMRLRANALLDRASRKRKEKKG